MFISLQPKGPQRAFSSTRVRKHQFFGTQSSFKEGNGNPLQYSYLENSMERGAWWAAVHGVAQSWTWLKQFSMHACIGEGNGNPLQYSCLENPRDRGAWWAAICGVVQSWIWLKHFSSSSGNQLNNSLFTSVLKISSNEIIHTNSVAIL